MTATIEEVDLSSFEDIAPPCDYKEHDEHGTGPAVWVITLRSKMTCGCPAPGRVYLMCEGCWAYMNSKGGQIYCRRCFDVHLAADDILSVVRL